MMLSGPEYAFLSCRRVGHLATADSAAKPHVVPVCFAIGEHTLYTAVDEKPKRTRDPKRLKNIRENPDVVFLADRYDEDWSRLGWVMIRGGAEILEEGDIFRRGGLLLQERYPQYRSMMLMPVIAVRILQVRSWGNLDE